MNELIKLLPEQHKRLLEAAKAYSLSISQLTKSALDDAHAELFRSITELQQAAKGESVAEAAKWALRALAVQIVGGPAPAISFNQYLFHI